jgi:peptide deformylase
MKSLTKNLEFLRKPCQKVTLKKGMEIARQLLAFARKYNKDHLRQSIGLAANQLGINAAVCIVLLDGLQLSLVNPKIISHSAEQFINKEGCLSLPGVTVEVPRWIWVKVEADNWPCEKTFGVDLSGASNKSLEQAILESACVQHEYDHILGRLITDYT